MHVPVEFRSACKNLCQGFDEFVSSPQDLAAHFLIGADTAAIRVIEAFIDDVLSSSLSDKKLVEFWNSMPADILIEDGAGVRRLLATIRQFSSPKP